MAKAQNSTGPAAAGAIARRGQGATQSSCGSDLTPHRQVLHLRLSASRTTSRTRFENCATMRRCTSYRALHAQGATEYLIVFAIVLLIALGVVALIGSNAESIKPIGRLESQIYWKNMNPLPVFSASSAYGTICGQASSGGYQLLEATPRRTISR